MRVWLHIIGLLINFLPRAVNTKNNIISMQELWNTTLVCGINLKIRGAILSMCEAYKMLRKLDLRHCYPAVYAAPGLVFHGRRRSPGYCHLKPWLCVVSVLQGVVLIVNLPLSVMGLFFTCCMCFAAWNLLPNVSVVGEPLVSFLALRSLLLCEFFMS